MQGWNYFDIFATAWALTPLLAFGFAGEAIVAACERLPTAARLILPAIFGVPYMIAPEIHFGWLLLYLGLPILVSLLLFRAASDDPGQRGNWRDFLILILLGLTVDMRWFESAWPAHLHVVNKLILLDSGLYGFFAIRRLSGVGFDLKIRLDDLRTGLRELLFYAPLAVPLGLWLGFLHFRPHRPGFGIAIGTWLATFFGIAIPEEIYFRGWLQNLLERRLGRYPALLTTAALFGLAHFNRLGSHFNWRYVLLAAIAGIFYGRAWRERQRIAASAITHSCVDAIWSLWL